MGSTPSCHREDTSKTAAAKGSKVDTSVHECEQTVHTPTASETRLVMTHESVATITTSTIQALTTTTHQAKKRKAESDRDTIVPSKPKRITRKKPLNLALAPPPPVNPSDPCSVLPVEIWDDILGYLPLSQVARISLVSKAWLEGSRGFPQWRTICLLANLGTPKRKYRSYLALAGSFSSLLCDQCGSYSRVGIYGRTSRIPLPVACANDWNRVWNLCWGCRTDYYTKFPERMTITAGEGDKIKKAEVLKVYGLNKGNLARLPSVTVRTRRGTVRWQLYEPSEVQKLAFEVHAGWVGIEAVQSRAARRKTLAGKKRDKAFCLKRINAVSTRGGQRPAIAAPET